MATSIIPTSDTSFTTLPLQYIEEHRASKSFLSRELLSRTTDLAALSTLTVFEASLHTVVAVAKLPFAATRLVLPRLLSDRYSFTEVGCHLNRTIQAILTLLLDIPRIFFNPTTATMRYESRGLHHEPQTLQKLAARLWKNHQTEILVTASVIATTAALALVYLNLPVAEAVLPNLHPIRPTSDPIADTTTTDSGLLPLALAVSIAATGVCVGRLIYLKRQKADQGTPPPQKPDQINGTGELVLHAAGLAWRPRANPKMTPSATSGSNSITTHVPPATQHAVKPQPHNPQVRTKQDELTPEWASSVGNEPRTVGEPVIVTGHHKEGSSPPGAIPSPPPSELNTSKLHPSSIPVPPPVLLITSGETGVSSAPPPAPDLEPPPPPPSQTPPRALVGRRASQPQIQVGPSVASPPHIAASVKLALPDLPQDVFDGLLTAMTKLPTLTKPKGGQFERGGAIEAYFKGSSGK